MVAAPDDEVWEDDEAISEFCKTARHVIQEDFEFPDTLDE